MKVTTTIEAKTEAVDILKAMKQAKYHLDRERGLPASFTVHDVSDFVAKVKDLTHVKSSEGVYEYMGIKIVANEMVLPGTLVVSDAQGTIQQIVKYD